MKGMTDENKDTVCETANEISNKLSKCFSDEIIHALKSPEFIKAVIDTNGNVVVLLVFTIVASFITSTCISIDKSKIYENIDNTVKNASDIRKYINDMVAVYLDAHDMEQKREPLQ